MKFRDDKPDYVGQNFSGNDWKLLALTGRTFERCDLSRVIFDGQRLRGYTFVECNFHGCVANYADFSHTDLIRCDLSFANFHRAILTGSNLSESNLYSANLACAVLKECNLVNANLINANLSQTLLWSSNYNRSTTSNIKTADYVGKPDPWHRKMVDAIASKFQR